jgi:hypothetical protein
MGAQKQGMSHDERSGDTYLPAIMDEQCALITPLEANPERWEKLTWTNRDGEVCS